MLTHSLQLSLSIIKVANLRVLSGCLYSKIKSPPLRLSFHHHHHPISTLLSKAMSSNPNTTSGPLTLSSTVRLSSGYDMPLLGFGVFQNHDATPTTVVAFEAGYRHVDSAQMYRNEAEVGEAVRKAGLARSEVFITTKCTSKTHGYEKTLKGVEESLAKMKFDYIDLFLIHDPLSGTEKRLATYKALLEKQKEGKIRSVGVSNYGPKHLDEIKAAGLPLPSVNQIELHPLCQQKPIVEWCTANGVVVQAYCPILRGQMDHQVIQDLSAKYDRDPAQVLIRWSLQKGFVPLPKSATPARIRSNAEVYDFELAPEDIAKLDALDQGKSGSISWNPVDAA